jgi:hypothetical protein
VFGEQGSAQSGMDAGAGDNGGGSAADVSVSKPQSESQPLETGLDHKGSQENAAVGGEVSSGVPKATATGAPGADAAGAGVDGAAPKFASNFKFKVKDKELEFDDFIKPLVKDAETEKKVRELYEKAYGLDEVKADRQALKETKGQLQEKLGAVETSLKTLGSFVQAKDYASFFEALRIPKQDIIEYAIEQLKYQELPPEQRRQLDMQRQQQLDYRQKLAENEQMQTQMQQLVVQQVSFEIDQAMSQPSITDAVKAFETRLGRPGAFKEEVIRRGQYYETVHKTSPPASQLVSEVLQITGAQMPQAPQGPMTQGAPQATNPGQGVAQNQAKPVIPAFSGAGGQSPVKKMPTSIDDLRKIRAQRLGVDN